ncbi:mCG147503 [Mus musculus]|nr:mCG147503 [Mus musculus]
MPLSLGLAFRVCWGTQDCLRWECCVLMMGRCPDFWSLCRLVLAGSGNQDVSGRCSGIGLPGRADSSPLARKVPGCLEPEMGPALEVLWLLPDPEAVSFCSPHSHLCRLVLAGSENQDVSSRYSGNGFPGRANASPLAGKVPGSLK